MRLEETILFKTSCFTTYIDWEGMKDLLAEISKLKVNHWNTRVQKSNVGGFQSTDFKSPNYDNRHTKILFENFIIPCAQKVKDTWSIPCQMNDVSYWYNINNKWTFNREHIHNGAFLSGVIYLKVPNNSGRIVFTRSTNEYDRMWHIQKELSLNNLSIDNPEINTEHWFNPTPGLLLLFPGHVTHYVEQNKTEDLDDERISISFNF